MIDADVETTLPDEHLLNAEGYLEIIKEFDLSVGKISAKIYANAHHPTGERGGPAAAQQYELKARVREVGIAPAVLDQHCKAPLASLTA